MKASVSPRIVLIAALAVASTLASSLAQDVVVQKNNQSREGQITGFANGSIKIKIGPVETSIPMDQVASVKKAPPKAYDDALAAWQKGSAPQTLATLKPLVETYRGLPTPWAERASALLGDVYLSLDQLPNAESAFAAFQKAYPNSASLSDVGLARLAISKKDYAAAKAKLAPIVAESETVIQADPSKNATYGQACYLMGMINEAEGNFPDALKNYLSAVTVFSEDKAIASKAQERADILIKEKQVIVP